MAATPPPIVLGIDPGTHRLGWGVVFRRGSKYHHVAHGVLRAPARAELPERLRILGDGLERVIADVDPTVVAIEQAFVHLDPHAALVIGHARGVAMFLTARAGKTVFEYPPTVVKRAVVGTGRADKAQVAAMIRSILGLDALPPEDAADALGVAVCHAGSLPLPTR
ncbi:MAG: crossover junction endodeoxyribonuclease RuvC [Myxococcales bacterium]|nr:crossover junction endodeoxyribonuclease RuvC [Myxococcales bacterium]